MGVFCGLNVRDLLKALNISYDIFVVIVVAAVVHSYIGYITCGWRTRVCVCSLFRTSINSNWLICEPQ